MDSYPQHYHRLHQRRDVQAQGYDHIHAEMHNDDMQDQEFVPSKKSQTIVYPITIRSRMLTCYLQYQLLSQ